MFVDKKIEKESENFCVPNGAKTFSIASKAPEPKNYRIWFNLDYRSEDLVLLVIYFLYIYS